MNEWLECQSECFYVKKYSSVLFIVLCKNSLMPVACLQPVQTATYTEVRTAGRINLLEDFGWSCAASHLHHYVVFKIQLCFLKKIIIKNQELNLAFTVKPVRNLVNV